MIMPAFLPRSDAVLLLEEDRVLADLIQISLKRRGFKVVATADPSEMEEWINKINPLVVLIDLFLSGTNGLKLLETLKGSGILNKRKVIVISAYSFVEIVQQAIQMGVVDFVIKPVNVDLLVQKIIKWSEAD
jgi:DNA-binding NtrC family response regulator